MTTKKLTQVSIVILTLGFGGWLNGKLETAPSEPAMMFDPALKMPARIERLLRRSCADCHSEGTRWPWYANVPPASWLVRRDVERAQKAMNLSKWSGLTPGAATGLLTAACADLQSKRMPMGWYLLLHPNARINAQDIRNFCAWTRLEGAELIK